MEPALAAEFGTGGAGLTGLETLAASGEGTSQEIRQRIASALKGYLLTVEWAASQANPA